MNENAEAAIPNSSPKVSANFPVVACLLSMIKFLVKLK
jgi:hypothetical protein